LTKLQKKTKRGPFYETLCTIMEMQHLKATGREVM